MKSTTAHKSQKTQSSSLKKPAAQARSSSAQKSTAVKSASKNAAKPEAVGAKATVSSKPTKSVDASLFTIALFAGAVAVGGYFYLKATSESDASNTENNFDLEESDLGLDTDEDLDLEMRSVDDPYDSDEEASEADSEDELQANEGGIDDDSHIDSGALHNEFK